MRIPVPIVILVALLAIAGFWHLRTKDMDFLTPTGTVKPLPKFMTESSAPDPDPLLDPGSPIIGSSVANNPNPNPSSGNADQPQLEFGDLESSPGLGEYSELASKGAGYLMRLATELEIQGQWERSLLAWERVIDSCHPSSAERTIAEDSIVRIRPTLTHWNIDPEGDLPILLQLGTTRRATANLKEAAQEAADFFRKDSDYTLLVTPRITTSRNRDAPANAPIAIYFSGTGSAEKNQSDLQSITPQGDEVDAYRKQILSAAYQVVRQSVGLAGGAVPPRTANNDEDPSTRFQRGVTRLHWKIFGESLTAPPNEDGQN